MTPEERYQKLKEIFLEARDLEPGERPRFLDQACRFDSPLREEIEALLAEHEKLGEMREDRVDGGAPTDGRECVASETTAEVSSREHSLFGKERPDRIGPFRILEILGEGGMGVVYLAEQTTPIRRRVALKCMTRTDHKEFLARFDSERQALALMNHPNIAKVYDAGATEDGQPYLAMEHVQGVPIDEYCDQHRLSITERLRLFVQVCQGIEHAHHRGVIHRDIKPSNILVSTPDEEPVAKIIDFGVAKATNQRLTERTLYTEVGRVIGTPQYMSPEQAKTTKEDVDHRTDIYSLGVLLYELLVGQLPLELDVRAVALEEVLRRIREEEPPTPSTRWSQANLERTTELASRRDTTTTALRHELRGDLDWISMKAIEKERRRRYATAAQLAQDVERHLRGEPAEAGPPGVVYRIRKYVRRHRVPVVATCAVVLALTIGLVASVVFALAARESAREAQDNLALAKTNERDARDNLALARKNEQEAKRYAGEVQEKAAEVQARLDEVLRLSDLKDLDDYRKEADRLWPASSGNVDRMKDWLEKAKELEANIDEHRETLRKLRDKALPPSEEDRKHDRETHPKAGELAQLEQNLEEAREELGKLEKAGHSADGVTLLSYGDDWKAKHPTYYFRRAFELKSPEALTALEVRVKVDDGLVLFVNGKEVLRRNVPEGEVSFLTWASECLEEEPDYEEHRLDAEGLIVGRNLVAAEVHQHSPSCSDLHFDLELLSVPKEGESAILIPRGSVWRYHDRGEDLGEDWRSGDYGDSAWPTGRGPFGYGYTEGAGKAAELKKGVGKLEEKIAALDAEVSKQPTWRFEDSQDAWWHNTLERLVRELEAFTDPDPFRGTIASVKKRLEFAETVRKRTIEDVEEEWNEAIASIANEEECPLYKGLKIKAQEGLVPIGQDPDSKLWEFAHLQTGEVPERSEDGKLILTEETGLVCVLLPGGTFKMGASRLRLGARCSEREGKLLVEKVSEGSLAARAGVQRGDLLLGVAVYERMLKKPEDIEQALSRLSSGETVTLGVVRENKGKVLSAEVGPNVDPQAESDEAPVHEITLEAFFLSKYEMTQGQWFRFKGKNPSGYGPDRKFGDKQYSLLHPVEEVRWEDCNEVLNRLGLVLPTEAQWEYGCRGGTTTVWWTGSEREGLQGAANLADISCKEHGGPATWTYEEFDDGYTAHAPAGSFEANPFGLHDTHGNVWEWCRDWYGSYRLPVKPGDGERQVPSRARDRVYRGGCFIDTARFARSAIRNSSTPGLRAEGVGARPARGLITE